MMVRNAALIMDPFALLLGEDLVYRGILPHHKMLINQMKKFRGICKQIVLDRKAGKT